MDSHVFFKQYVKPYWRSLAFAVILAVFGAILNSASIYSIAPLFKVILDKGGIQTTTDTQEKNLKDIKWELNTENDKKNIQNTSRQKNELGYSEKLKNLIIQAGNSFFKQGNTKNILDIFCIHYSSIKVVLYLDHDFKHLSHC